MCVEVKLKINMEQGAFCPRGASMPKGGKYVSVCKAYGTLGGSGGMIPQEILILDLLLDAIWWNLGLFLHKHNLPFIIPST